MSSSGLIYAVIVGAWAVYLVPMWLRREDELNRARQTQRYAAAIKVLANKEAFERRWASSREESLPMAVGQNFAPAPPAPSHEAREAARPKKAVPAPGPGKRVATSRVDAAPRPSAGPARKAAPRRPARPDLAKPAPKASTAPSRGGLMARRRRVVSFLFAISTLGALVTADLGAHYLWAMAVPALVLSAYIVRLRQEEQTRASVHRHAAAERARTAESAESDRSSVSRATGHVAAPARQPEEQRRAQVARRRSAAARARAQTYTAPEEQELPRVANG